ncbi:MAG: hypothetical protein SFX18_14355 [Pirellulales bacterium]|nr:hypothetical protein [Pirellulales bacterium]
MPDRATVIEFLCQEFEEYLLDDTEAFTLSPDMDYEWPVFEAWGLGEGRMDHVYPG